MKSELNMNREETIIQGLLAGLLISRKPEPPSTAHLDQDTLAAFTEGSLTEREIGPTVSHLVDCNFCRHITAELVRLDLEFAGASAEVPSIQEGSPARISEVLSGILSKMFGTTENAVFAHHEEEDDDKKDKDKGEG